MKNVKKNEAVFTAIEQTLNADDADKRCEYFAEVLLDAINTDNDPRDRCGRYVLKAIAENSVDDLLIAICGWSAASLMKKATILHDTDGRFDGQTESAAVVSVWNL